MIIPQLLPPDPRVDASTNKEGVGTSCRFIEGQRMSAPRAFIRVVRMSTVKVQEKISLDACPNYWKNRREETYDVGKDDGKEHERIQALIRLVAGAVKE